MKKDIYHLISTINKNPIMYLGEPNIYYLKNYLIGFCVGSSNDNLIVLNEFQDWIQKKYVIQKSISWAEIISEIALREELDALLLFFSLFEEFSTS